MTNLVIPARIGRLRELSSNFWWSWNPSSRELFRSLDYHLWNLTHHNPVLILRQINQRRLDWAVKDEEFLSLYDNVLMELDRISNQEDNWFSEQKPENFRGPIVYFSFEFGLHQSLPIYSGGLGILAGDICKEASDLGIPFIAIGFFYKHGYFKQVLPSHGWQEALSIPIDMDSVSIDRVKKNKEVLKLNVKIGNEDIWVQFWLINVGSTRLYLLDTDLQKNKPWYRSLSSKLYQGDREIRLTQELLLGIGGVKLIQHLELEPSVWHLNEGHCSFVSLMRIQSLMSSGTSYDNALDIVKTSTNFTTHTVVPAGHDTFDINHVRQKLEKFATEAGVSVEKLLHLGINYEKDDNQFNMTVLAINTANHVNGVSQLHTEITKEEWKSLIKTRIPRVNLTCITNGVHLLSWISGPMRRLFNGFVDPLWNEKSIDVGMWKKIYNIPDKEFWRARTEAKNRLFHFLREKARLNRLTGKMDAEQLIAAGTFLDPQALTLGFARRFATYKRASLIFKDIDRVKKIINNTYKPVQIIFAGKAHPDDESGKYVLQQIYEHAREATNGGRICFVDDYDMHAARFLVQGVDVWLNTPMRPMEASGTSGIKAAINGVPHFSISDGWWAEGYNRKNGWKIGTENRSENSDAQNEKDADSLYNILEERIVPLYYDRQENNLPKFWIEISKNSIVSTIPIFSAKRMVQDYTEQMYLPTFINRAGVETQ